MGDGVIIDIIEQVDNIVITTIEQPALTTIEVVEVTDTIQVEVTEIVEEVQVDITETTEEINITVTEGGEIMYVPGVDGEVVIIDHNRPISSGILIDDLGGGTEVELIAGEILNGQVVVIYDGTGLFLFDPTNENHYLKVIGFTKTSAVQGQLIKVLSGGEIIQQGWGLTPGELYYATINGQITLDPTGLTILQSVGIAKDSNTLLIQINQPLILI